jgi:hypothetical protein
VPSGVVTIPGVELVASGDWHGTVNGVAKMTRVTAAELADMAAAALDPEVDHAPVKIGHFGAWADLGDSAPSLGWVRNHRVEMRAPLGPDGKPAGAPRPTLVGDLTDVPAGLADVMPKAFRRRSAEFVTAKPGAPITTPSGRSYAAVLTGLALLGVQPPAVKGLNDVLALYDTTARVAASAGGPAGEAVSILITEGAPSDGVLVALGTTSAAFAATVADGSTTVEQANAILDTIYAAAGIPDATIHVPNPSARHDDPRDVQPKPGGPVTMDEAKLRELLGIEADADIEKAATELKAKADKADAAAPVLGPDGKPVTAPAATAPAATAPAAAAPAATAPAATAPAATATTPAPTTVTALPDLVAAAAANPAGVVTLSAGAAAELVQTAQLGANAMAALDQQARAGAIATAIREGRITPNEAAVNFAAPETNAEGQVTKAGGPWSGFLAQPPAALTTFFSGLTPRFPVTELGAAGDVTDTATEEKTLDAVHESIFAGVTGI